MSLIRRQLMRDEGQMSVEFVLAIPAFMVGLIVMFNVMTFVAECSRFDRVAGEIARSSVVNAATATTDLRASLDYPVGSPFEAVALPPKTNIPLTSHIRVTCVLKYRPWPFNGYAFGGIRVGEWSHAQTFIVDEFQPGAVF